MSCMVLADWLFIRAAVISTVWVVFARVQDKRGVTNFHSPGFLYFIRFMLLCCYWASMQEVFQLSLVAYSAHITAIHMKSYVNQSSCLHGPGNSWHFTPAIFLQTQLKAKSIFVQFTHLTTVIGVLWALLAGHQPSMLCLNATRTDKRTVL